MPVLTGLIATGLSAIGAGAIGGGALIITPGLTLGMTATSVALAQGISTALLAVGASYGLSALNKTTASTQRNEITIKQALPGRWIDIGRVKSGGAVVFYAAPGMLLYTVKVLSCTKIHTIEALWLDDWLTADVSGLNSGGTVGGLMGPWTAYVLAEARHGADDQAWLSLPGGSGSWTVDHRLRGCAAVAIAYAQAAKDKFTQFYPNGAPNVTALLQGALLPEPRDTSHALDDDTAWSYGDNAARALTRYAIDRDGWGLEPADLHLSSWQQACADCDDAVATTTGTEPRYRAWGRWSTTEERKSVLEAMLANMGATLIEQPDGTYALFVGKHREPTVTIDETMIRDIQMERFPDALSRVDGVKARITWEGADWQEQECPTVYASGSPGSAPDIEDLALPWCPSPYQAQRLSKARALRARAEWAGTIKTNLAGLRAYGEPVIRLVYPELGIDGTFEVTSQPTLDTSDMSVTLGLRSYAPDTWSMAGEEMGEMGAAATVDEDYTAPEPEGLASAVDDLTVTVTWDVRTDEDAYVPEAQWRATGYDWVPAEDVEPGEVVIEVPTHGTTYDVRVRRVSARGYTSDWAILPDIEVD